MLSANLAPTHQQGDLVPWESHPPLRGSEKPNPTPSPMLENPLMSPTKSQEPLILRVWVTQKTREAPENNFPENASTAIVSQVSGGLGSAREMAGVNDPTGLFQSKQFHTML